MSRTEYERRKRSGRVKEDGGEDVGIVCDSWMTLLSDLERLVISRRLEARVFKVWRVWR